MFRDDFVWGVASSSYQIEGRDPDDGRGRTIWEDFFENGGGVEGQDAEIACDHIHRYEEDFALMEQLGIRAYRFSVNWARILPQGVGKVNEQGVILYRNMILSMQKHHIKPYLTLFHWEFPQALQDQGGWLNPASVEWFSYYAAVVAERFGDLVDSFITLNEPECFVGLGHLRGENAPGFKLPLRETFLIAHHALCAHGAGVRAIRAHAGRPVQIGYAPTCGVPIPLTENPRDIEAARQVYFGMDNPPDNWAWTVSWFSDPVFLGKYPEVGLKKYRNYLPEFSEDDMRLISEPIDYMGENIYNGYPVRMGEDGEPEALPLPQGTTRTAMDWPVTPECIYWGLRFLDERYHMPMYVTENGMACHDAVSVDGRVHDPNRIHFVDAYLGQVQRAMSEGADVRGYFLWTYMDNYEWTGGYEKRFGIVHVDYETQKRTPKDSAYWYREIIRSNGKGISANGMETILKYLTPAGNIYDGE